MVNPIFLRLLAAIKFKTENRQKHQKIRKDSNLFFQKNREKMQTYQIRTEQNNDHTLIIHKIQSRR